MCEQEFLVGKKVLITGITGLIGRGLAYILSKNNEVHGAARFSNPKIEKELSSICHKLYKLDLSKKESVESLPKDYDVVFNLAVHWGEYRGPLEKDWNTFIKTMEVNSFLPARLILHFKDTQAKLVFGSTGSLYTPSKNRKDLHVEGKTCWEGGECIYEDTKMGGDILIYWISQDFKVPAIILRYYWPEAPYTGGGRIGYIVRSFLKGQSIKASRVNPWWHNLGYISDIVYATIAAANFVAIPAPIYNVSGEEITNTYEKALVVAEELGIEPKIEEVEDEGPSMYLADVSKMKRDLWKPQIGLKECVRRVVKAIKEEINTPQDWMFE